jgi:Concanavalin A-like lectin/glucanases superfamily
MNGVLGIQLADAQNTGWTNYLSGINIADGQPHYIAVTVSRTQPDGGHFYISGKEAGSRFNPTDRQGSLNNTQPLVIGQRSDSPSSPELFQGEIGDLKLFNRVLSASEIANLAGVPTPPVGGPADPNDLNWYMAKAGLPTIQEIGEERWFSACDITAQQGAVTFNTGRVMTCIYNSIPGWVIAESKVDVLENINGRGSYTSNILAEGANIGINEQEIGDKWKIALDLAVKFADVDLQRKLNVEYQRHQELIRAYNTNKNTFFLQAIANGGLFRKSVIHVKGSVRCIRL